MSEKIDPVIAEALRVAASKRTFDKTKGLKVSRRDLAGFIPPPLPASDYCDKCQYPKVRGVYSECSKCEELDTENRVLAAKYAEMIGGRKGWEEYRESNLTRTTINTPALEAAKKFNPKVDNLLLFGPRGTGKSHIAGIAKRRMILAGVNVVTVSMPDIIGEIVASFGKGGSKADEMVKKFTRVSVLSIEDVGAGEKASEYVIKFYFRVIDGRYKENKNGLIITLNDTLDVLEDMWSRFDSHGRVVSRLKEMCKCFSFIGEQDWRAAKARDRKDGAR